MDPAAPRSPRGAARPSVGGRQTTSPCVRRGPGLGTPRQHLSADMGRGWPSGHLQQGMHAGVYGRESRHCLASSSGHKTKACEKMHFPIGCTLNLNGGPFEGHKRQERIPPTCGGYPPLASKGCGGYPPRCGEYPQDVEDTRQDVEHTPKMWRIPGGYPPRYGGYLQDEGQKSKIDKPGAVKSHLKTSRKWTVFHNLWREAHGQSPEDTKDTPPVPPKRRGYPPDEKDTLQDVQDTPKM